MNTKILLIILGVLLVGIIIVFIVIRNTNDNNIKIEKKNPNELELAYEINAGIPFRWEYEIEDESTVSFVKKYQISNDNSGAKVGGKIKTNYVFKGLKEGETTITFKYVNFADNYIDKKIKHMVMVDKDLNITLINND